jgi:hypothetical protein
MKDFTFIGRFKKIVIYTYRGGMPKTRYTHNIDLNIEAMLGTYVGTW